MKGQSKGLLSRWYLKISQYLTFEHKPGKSNEAADALSRAPVPMETAPDDIGMVLNLY